LRKRKRTYSSRISLFTNHSRIISLFWV